VSFIHNLKNLSVELNEIKSLLDEGMDLAGELKLLAHFAQLNSSDFHLAHDQIVRYTRFISFNRYSSSILKCCEYCHTPTFSSPSHPLSLCLFSSQDL
jgi:hypothetical protein